MATDPAAFVSPHGLANRVARLAWNLFWLLFFRPSPWFLGAYRSWLLRIWGAQLGQRVRLASSVRIWAPWRLRAGDDVYVDDRVYLYNTYGITFGSRVVVSFNSTLCTATHDISEGSYPLKGAPIVVGNDVWIAAEAFILPGRSIGNGAVIGARSLVSRDVPAWKIIAGNPGQVVADRKMSHGEATDE